MFKHQGHKVGQKIRAYDFEPISGRPDMYVEGVITHAVLDGTQDAPYAHYLISVTKDTTRGQRTGVYVPMEVSMFEWDGRVSAIIEEAV